MIWPWSTIRQLRGQLEQAKQREARWREALALLLENHEEYIRLSRLDLSLESENNLAHARQALGEVGHASRKD